MKIYNFLIRVSAVFLVYSEAIANSGPFLDLDPTCAWNPGTQTVANLCEELKSCCGKLGLEPDCQNKPKVDPEKRNYAWNYFKKIKTQLAVTCCKTSRVCLEHFNKTELWIDKGIPPGKTVAVAFYSLYPNVVRYGDQGIYGCFTKGCIEYRILHELGHACQVSLAISDSTGKGDDPLGYYETKRAFANTIGESVGECVDKALMKHKRTSLYHPLGPGVWEREAFADLVFMNFRTNLDSFGGSCGGLEDPLHAQPKVYLHCFKGDKKLTAFYGNVYTYSGQTDPDQEAKTFEKRRKERACNAAINLPEACREINKYHIDAYHSELPLLMDGSETEIETEFPGLSESLNKFDLDATDAYQCLNPINWVKKNRKDCEELGGRIITPARKPPLSEGLKYNNSGSSGDH